MDNNYIFSEHSSRINDIIVKFNSMQRIKIKSFDVSANFIVFGASSGGIYVLRREPCEYFKIIPSKEGSADIIAMSNNEKYLSVGTEKGLVIIYENFKEFNMEHQLFNEHAGNKITAMKWHNNILCIGDESGKVSIASQSALLTKAIFQVPSESIMQLDSSVVQIDAYNNYLLISTTTKACLCNTNEECYIQIGKKLRNGNFGACFCQNMPTSESTDICNKDDCKIYCARPGQRLWEASLNANVIMTYQFKEALKIIPTDVLLIRHDKNATLDENLRFGLDNDKVDENFNFQKIYAMYSRFIFTYYDKELYIFDLITNKLLFWFRLFHTIKDVAILNNTLYVWQDNMELRVFSFMKLEDLILQTLYNEQYILCAEMCVKYCDKLLKLIPKVPELYLIDILTTKLSNSSVRDQLLYVLNSIKDHNESIIIKNTITDENIKENKHEQYSEENKQDNNCKTLLKQYIVNKTHNRIKVPEAQKILNVLSIGELFMLLNYFNQYISKELNEDATEWCQEQFLQQIDNRDMVFQELPDYCLDYLTNAVININKSVKYSCSCGYPLPICHKYEPNHCEIVLDILTNRRDMDTIFKEIPYILMISNCSKNIQRLCLNCDGPINVDGLISWTEMGKIVLQLLGPTSTIRILKCFERKIPAGALDATFYQTCIVGQVFKNNADIKTSNKAAVAFVDKLEGETYNEFQRHLDKYFNKKYLKNSSLQSSSLWVDSKAKCPICKLSLKNDAFDCETGKTCQHIFHSICLKHNNGNCTFCTE
ncbi:hypothetical protein GWI33_016061 [Rhynchophorus ferrugineus]|uniref:RING-type domain-containing protein n=1 Tax=Rhynchophorus ferrugineus TaxID=354439 RepID=A0A834M3Q8_RHYFE|nr:hypothetical protein GWI33_016061 [Rhynchophorus ferrugineus]